MRNPCDKCTKNWPNACWTNCKYHTDLIATEMEHERHEEPRFPTSAYIIAGGEPDYGGAFDGFTVTSDADPGL